MARTERVLGRGLGPVRAFAAAVIAGSATGALTCRLLRIDSLGGEED